MSQVSCRITHSIAMYLKNKGVSAQAVVNEANSCFPQRQPFSVEFITDSRKFLPWDFFIKFIEVIDERFADFDWKKEAVAESFQAKYPWLSFVPFFLRMVTSTKQLYWLMYRWGGPNMYRCMDPVWESAEKGRVKFEIKMHEGFPVSETWARLVAYSFEMFPRVLGYKDAAVKLQVLESSYKFEISLPPEKSIVERVKKWGMLVLTPGKVFSELDRKDAYLFENYKIIADSEQKLIRAQFELEARVDERTRQLQLANEAKNLFLANVSHEIRTPLNAILGFSELLTSEEFSVEQRKKFSSSVQRNGSILLRIIDDVLDVSRIEAGTLVLSPVQFLIKQELLKLVEFVKSGLSDRSIQLQIEFSENFPDSFCSDVVRVNQIISNLLNNSIKFTERGSIRVAASYDELCEEIMIKVSDTGRGISSDKVEKIFEPFTQGDSSYTKEVGGAGLGLALSQKLANSMGGEVYLFSTAVDKGSEFVLRLPPMKSTVDVAQKSFAGAEQKVLPPMSVLLVEDNMDNCLVFSHMFNSIGVKPLVVHHGREALAAVETQGSFSVIFMDLQMPVMDGYEALKRLREQGYNKPIIAITAHALNDERQRALTAGFDDFIVKPVNAEALRFALQQVI